MPLAKWKKNIWKNIKLEMSHWKPQKQAIAIALTVAKIKPVHKEDKKESKSHEKKETKKYERKEK